MYELDSNLPDRDYLGYLSTTFWLSAHQYLDQGRRNFLQQKVMNWQFHKLKDPGELK